jgi:uncharacterized coiled-coil protein SlyX
MPRLIKRHDALEESNVRKNMITKTWVIATSMGALIIGLLSGMMVWRPDSTKQNVRLEGQALEEKRKTIEALEKNLTELRKELDESSKQIATLQARLDDARLRPSETQSDEARLSRRDGLTRESGQPVQGEIYETSRTTAVYQEPSDFSRRVATIVEGTIVTVVGSTGEWLQIRSRRGNPPGFVHRRDVRLVRNSTANSRQG